MTRPRFYAPDLDLSIAETRLPADESHHLVRVMRLVAGDEVAVFDGRGHEFQARVVLADRRGATVVIGDPIVTASDPGVPTVLVQAVLKGDKMDGVVRDATMAGVARIVPVVTDRSVVGLSALGRAHASERWQRVAIASAKQCRRARLPAIDPPRSFGEWLEAPFDGRRVLLVEPSADAPEESCRYAGPLQALRPRRSPVSSAPKAVGRRRRRPPPSPPDAGWPAWDRRRFVRTP